MINGQGHKELLNDRRVQEEISKHLWIESQKAGHSIGRERATEEWLHQYAEQWMKYNMPERYVQLASKQKKSGKTLKRKRLLTR